MRTKAALLLLSCLGCSSSEREREGSEPPPSATPDEEPAAAPARFEGVGRHLPHPSLSGWRQHGEVRYFDASSLFEYIDGAAEGYLEYGFRRLATTEYSPEATTGGSPRTVTVEIYDMGAPTGAFGKWSRIASERGDPVELASRIVQIGGGAMQGSADLVLWRGKHLVKLTYLDEDPNATEESVRAGSRDILGRMARVLARRLPGTTDPPGEIRKLPTDGRIAHSAVFYARDVLGRDGLGPGWRAWYEHDGKRMLLARAGRATWDALRGAEGASPVRGLGDEALRFEDSLLGETLLARKGDVTVLAADPDLPDVPKADLATKTELVLATLDL